ncbi:putative quinol monooxygenase [Amphritea sp.]|uniref:putative quinol monooxygenase n=1 Tax=Amphritea sp. TaxID=1872502 RepID=UPI003A950BD0
MSKVILQGFIIVPEEDLAALKQALPEHAELTRDEPGCLLFEVEPHASDPYRFDVYEEFVSQAAFDLHQQRVKQSRWGAVSAHAIRHYEIIG